jgi:hypothetical protein
MTPDVLSPAFIVKILARGAVIENVSGRAIMSQPT